ncbi:MAG: metallophosphoesterase [Candidatus Hydrogenedentes bacterium]|nr:metallophosphoesterase [Candidatus Hydrogenedentota bacterium]
MGRRILNCLAVCILLACMGGAAWAEEAPAFVPGSWTLVVLPDTQRYTVEETDPGLKIFPAITQWIADNKSARNIQLVLHEGDVTGGNLPSTWEVASDAMAILDDAGIGYCIAPGNHDYDGSNPHQNSPSRDATLLNEYFPVSRYERMPTFGGTFEPGNTENSYHLFSTGNTEYIALAMEWGPRDEVIAWADMILSEHSDRTAFIVTHAYTYSDGTRYDWAAKGPSQDYNPHCESYAFSAPHDGTENVNDGEQLWQKLISKHSNIRMVFSGHVRWAGARQTATGKDGRQVHEMVAVYHDPPEGWIRLLEFRPDGRTVQVKTYSPYLDRYMTDDAQQFVLDLAPSATKDILIRELDKAAERDGIQTDPAELNLWKALPYESEEFSGVMLGEGGGTEQQPITIRLGAQGAYRIFLGLYGGYDANLLRVKLTGDPSSDAVPIQVTGNRTLVISERYWKEADLTGKDLILEGSGDEQRPGALAYVRLESIRERKDAYPLVITNDGHGVFLGEDHTRPEDLLKSLVQIPDGTCMQMLLWGNGCADNCNYPTKVGQFYPNAGQQFKAESSLARNLGIWKENGWDSLQTARDYARKRNWEFQVYIRMEAFKAPFPFDGQENSTFFNEHPEFHCLDRDGQRVVRLSYAYPEVQQYMLHLIREIADYNPDGICLCFVRGVPLVLYEPIMVEGFMKDYGVDPRELDELDPRWMDYQGRVLTAFVKQVKESLDPAQRLSVIVPANELDCRRWGLDVATWVREGIVNDLFPTGQRFDEQDIHRDDPDNLDFTYFANLPGRENIRLIPLLYTWTKFQSDFAAWEQLVYSFLDQGADAYAVWDAEGENFTKVKDIGRTLDRYQRPEPPASREIKLRSLQGFRMDRYHYFEIV